MKENATSRWPERFLHTYNFKPHDFFFACLCYTRKTKYQFRCSYDFFLQPITTRPLYIQCQSKSSCWGVKAPEVFMLLKTNIHLIILLVWNIARDFCFEISQWYCWNFSDVSDVIRWLIWDYVVIMVNVWRIHHFNKCHLVSVAQCLFCGTIFSHLLRIASLWDSITFGKQQNQREGEGVRRI